MGNANFAGKIENPIGFHKVIRAGREDVAERDMCSKDVEAGADPYLYPSS
jgi:hypothetical protein